MVSAGTTQPSESRAVVVRRLALTAVVAVVAPSPVEAATVVVDSTADVVDGADGVTTLREAVIEANGTAGADTIVFDPTVFDPAGSTTITLGATLAVTDELVITGPGRTALTLETGGIDGVIEIDGVAAPLTVTDLSVAGSVGPSISVLDSSSPITIRRTTVTSSLGQGISLVNVGAVTLSDVSVTGSVDDNLYIEVSGDIDISDSGFDAAASAGADGIEIISGGAVTLTDVSAGDNADDGIEIDGIDGSTPDPVGPIVGTRVTTERNGENGIDIEIATDVTVSALVSNDNGPTDNDFGIGLGVFDATGSVTVTESEFRRNAGLGGGGVLVLDIGGDVTLTDLDITENEAEFVGGGLVVDRVVGATALTRLSIVDNEATDPDEANAAGALIVLDEGPLSIVDTTIAGNVSAVDGGGLIVVVDGSIEPEVTIERTTISNNSAADFDGGMAVFDTRTTIINSTITGNTAANGAAAVGVARGEATIRHSTITGNTATADAGVIAGADSTITLDHTIVSGNIGLGLAEVGGPTTTSSDHGFLSAGLVTDFPGSGNVTGDDPGLDPLGDDGGLTATMRPSPGSPVIDAGDAAITGEPTTDQRSGARVVNTVDIGAVEVDPGRLDLTPITVSVAEADGATALTVTRSGVGDGAVTADVITADVTATAGLDYTAVDTTVTWADGEIGARTVTVPILADAEVEPDETFTATLTDVTGSPVVGSSTSTVTITDSTTPPSTTPPTTTPPTTTPPTTAPPTNAPPTNAPPVITPVADRVLVVGGTDVVTVTVNDPDADPITLTATPSDPRLVGSVTVTEVTGVAGSLTAPSSIDRTFRLDYRSSGVIGEVRIDLVASDGSLADRESFVVSIEGGILPATGADDAETRSTMLVAVVLLIVGGALTGTARRRST